MTHEILPSAPTYPVIENNTNSSLRLKTTETIRPPIELKLHEGKPSFLGREETPFFIECSAGVELTDGRIYSTEDLKPKTKRIENGITLYYEGSVLRPAMEWQIVQNPENESFEITMKVTNTTDLPLPIETLRLLQVEGGLLNTPFAELKASEMGLETASPAWVPKKLPELDYLEVNSTFPPSRIGGIKLPYDRGSVLMHSMTQLVTPDGDQAIIGFTTAHKQAGFIQARPSLRGTRIDAFTAMEGIELDHGESITSEKLLVVLNQDEKSAKRTYYETVAENMHARPRREPVTLLCTWYEHEWAISEKYLKANVDILSARRDELPVDYVIVDDYFSPGGADKIGNTPLTKSPKFPSGFEEINKYMKEKGIKPGIWDAIFVVSEESDVFRDHPEWLVKDEKGDALLVKKHWGGNVYSLDGSHPEVLKYLKARGQKLREAGFDAVKLDFNFLGAARGVRYDRKATGIEAMRKGLKTYLEGFQPELDLGCASPFIASVGIFSTMRISPDSKIHWRDKQGRVGSYPSIVSSKKSFAAHSNWDRILFLNDPDVGIFRNHDTELSTIEKQTFATEIALDNNIIGIGDDLSKLEKKGFELYSFILPPSADDGPAEYLAFDNEGMPTRKKLEIKRPDGNYMCAAFFNNSETDEVVIFDPVEWGLDENKKYLLYDQWNQAFIGSVEKGAMILPVASHGTRTLTVHEDKKRPQVIGSSAHLLGGAVEIADQNWDGCNLTITTQNKSGNLAVHIPEEFVSTDKEGDMHKNILTVPFKKNEKIIIPFTKRNSSVFETKN